MNTPSGRTPDPDAARRETDELRARLDADERAALDRLTAAAKPDNAPPLRLDAERRERLLATLRTPVAPATAHDRGAASGDDADHRVVRFIRAFRVISREYGFAYVAALFLVLAMLGGVMLPLSKKVRAVARDNHSADNLAEPASAAGESTVSFATGAAASDKAKAFERQPAKIRSAHDDGEAAPANNQRYEHKFKSRQDTRRDAIVADSAALTDPIPEISEERAAGETDGFAKAEVPAPSFASGISSGVMSKDIGGGSGSGIAIGRASAAGQRQSTGVIVSKNIAANTALPSAPAPAVAKKEVAANEIGALEKRNAADTTRADESDKDTAALPAAKPQAWEVAGAKPAEAPALVAANRETPAAQNAFSTFSLNVSDASFRMAVAANSLGRTPAPATQRAEEFVNSQLYRDPQPRPGEAFSFRTENTAHPFAPNRQLVRMSLRAAAEGRAAASPLNLVVALDHSGSMERADRLETTRAALTTLADKIGPADRVSVLGFARTQNLLVDRAQGPVAAAALRRLATATGTPEGGTNLEAALATAYAQLAAQCSPGAINRVILLTDGAANLGEGEPEKLAALVETNRKAGNALDCFGIGLDGYDDAMLERLARHGDGRYAFLNNAESVRDGFAEKIAGALRPAARDVKVQVEFNPDRVASWRLIGYDKHRLTKEQFRDNTVDAAELAAAETGTAVYVIEPKPDGRGDLGVARVRYLDPATGEYREESRTLPYRDAPAFDTAPQGVRLAAVAALTGELYGDAPEAATYDPDALAKAARRLASETPGDTRIQNLRELAEAAARNRK